LGTNLAVELLGRPGLCVPMDGNKVRFNVRNGRSLIQILFLLGGKGML